MPESETNRRSKSESAFRTISEAADDLAVPQHVLRFWETKFSQLRPMKRGGGRRYYRPEDLVLLRRIRGLLYDDGFTIRGVQKILKDGQERSLRDDVQGGAASAPLEPASEDGTVFALESGGTLEPLQSEGALPFDEPARAAESLRRERAPEHVRARVRDALADLEAALDLLRSPS